MATGEAPVLETLTDMTTASLSRVELDPATMLMVRLAALVAVDAPPASYLMHIGPAVESGITLEQVQDVLITVAPITGAPRVLSATRKITDALGFAIALVDAMDEADRKAHAKAGAPA